MSEALGFVRVENDIQQNCRVVKTIKSFRPGELVLREKPLLESTGDSDVKRLLAFCRLNAQQQSEFMKVFTDQEMRDRGASADDADLDSFTGILEKAVAEDASVNLLSKREVAGVVLRWRLAQRVNKFRIFKVASKLLHHCGAPVSCDINDSGMIALAANGDIRPQTRIGTWMLEDVDLWWKGANVRQEELIAEGVLNQKCCCERCLDSDACRTLKCPDCTTGEFRRNGKAKKWICAECDFQGSDDAMSCFIQVEAQLLEELSDLGALPKDRLRGLLDTVEERLGLRHWLAAALWKAIYQRFSRKRGAGSERNFTSIWAAMDFLEWLVSRQLPPPPEEMRGDLVAMGFAVLEFLQVRMTGVRDLRVVFLRALQVVRSVFGSMDRDLTDRLTPYIATASNMKRRCGFCETLLPEEAAEGQREFVPPSQWANEDSYEEETDAICCATCNELWYCDMGCQLADLPRHRPYCVPKNQPLCSKLVTQIMLPVN